MTPETIDKVLSAITTLGLSGLGILAYHLGAVEVGSVLVGGALGHSVPRRGARGGEVAAR